MTSSTLGIDIRTIQLTFNELSNSKLCKEARTVGREWVISIDGIVKERSNKNKNIATGDVEIEVTTLSVLKASKTPPFHYRR